MGGDFTHKERYVKFKTDAIIEWKDGRRWLLGKVLGQPQRDQLGRQYLPVRNLGGRTRNVDANEVVRVYRGDIRQLSGKS